MTNKGVFIISLDFELIWGVRDIERPNEIVNIQSAREVVERLLELFAKYEIHATWATVGFLFFENRAELLRNIPDRLPQYVNMHLSPYPFMDDELGDSESEDPQHFALSLVRKILQSPHQELATHTFSHYYCLEEGQTVDDFSSDLEAAISAAKKQNSTIESIVFPRNQYADAYLEICQSKGVLAYRGNEDIWFRKSSDRKSHRHWIRRLFRLSDAYVNLSGSNAYPLPTNPELPINLPSSRYLRPYSKRLEFLELMRLRRIISAMRDAANKGRVFHLWWHPEDFSKYPEENLVFLEKILVEFSSLRNTLEMKSFI